MFGLSATEVYQELPAWEVELLLMVARREHDIPDGDDEQEAGGDPVEPSQPPQVPKSRR